MSVNDDAVALKGGKGPWAKTLPPSSTIYSWVMNNHWHTNFPTTQEGPVTFRYRLYPHLNFDIVESNRFGLEQSQPLVHVTADKDPKLTPLLSVDNEQVYATILKSTGQDQELIVRLRSYPIRKNRFHYLIRQTTFAS